MNDPLPAAAPAAADEARTGPDGRPVASGGEVGLEEALATVTRALLAGRAPEGPWEGELSASALSTATAVIALATSDRQAWAGLIERGLAWLAANANADGGWGDTIRSVSNLSTTALGWAAFGAAQADDRFPATVASARRWIERRAGSFDRVVPAIKGLYGTDRIFSVPILMTLALSGRLGPDGWRCIPALPFELGALPPGVFGALRLPVVSYALPALIAIGQVLHHYAPSPNPVARLARHLTRRRTLDRLTALQPENGGFLEATPLTSFVVMSLAAMGHRDHRVARRGVMFLSRSVRPDGSWPIDTHLATWVTTLSIKALAHQPAALRALPREWLREWLLGQQFRTRHPYTQAAPGGWSWTPLPGGVPDADDTAGALLALHHLTPADERTAGIRTAAMAGVTWLLDLQNSDGGVPTFCRGWGTLPFDRSTPELTAHALRAWNVWWPDADARLGTRLIRATEHAHWYLRNAQRADGAWLPLWFGNEAAPDQANPVYGTSQVLLGLRHRPEHLPGPPAALAEAAIRFLVRGQNADGGWGGDRGVRSTIEETALAVEAITGGPTAAAAQARGVAWLAGAVTSAVAPVPAPIGLYFARLWYFERLYPLVFATSALGAAAARCPPGGPEWPAAGGSLPGRTPPGARPGPCGVA